MTKAIERLIRPHSIAVFGGSWAQSVVEQCQKMGYTGELWPVHPTKKDVNGLPCYSTIDALPEPPDASFLGVNRETTIELVGKLASMGAGGAVCFASGFSEAVDEDASAVALEQSLVAAAGDMPILGPNCYGFINCLDRALLWPDQHGAVATKSGVAIITQSSNIAINITMQTRGLPVAYVFTAGNQARISLAQLAIAALDDARVTAIGLHIEGFGCVREFEQLANHARKVGKPVIALKVGKTETARLALKSHTSSLAGSDASADAFLSRLGIARVHSLTVFIESLKLLHVSGGLKGNRMLSMSCSGGEACLMGDAAQTLGLVCPPLNNKQSKALRSALGPKVALANPLDYHTYIWNDGPAMQAMFSAMLLGEADIAVLVIDFPRTDRCTFESWLVAIDAYKSAGKKWSGQIAVLATLPENLPESIAIDLINEGVVPLCGLDDALAAISVAAVYASSANSSIQAEAVLLPNNNNEDGRELVAMEEDSAKKWLKREGVITPDGMLLITDDVQDINTYFTEKTSSLNWPLVLKSTGSLHKSDAGGVVLGIENMQKLMSAVETMHDTQRFFIEEQITGVVCELLVGIVRDPVHGFLMTLGAGGVQTELLGDTASGLLPLSRDALRTMLSQLNIYPVLNGYRGQPGCDIDKLIDSLMQIQDAATGIADDLFELEINPLICTEHNAVVADALLRVNRQSKISNFQSNY